MVALTLCACWLVDREIRFKEEVALASGEVMVASRFIKAKPLGEAGGWEPAYMSFEVEGAPLKSVPKKWESTAGLLPILFDQDSQTGEWVLLATFYTCEPWYALGRPKLPYAEFRFRRGNWEKVEFSPQWIGREANVLTDIRSGGEPEFFDVGAKNYRMSDIRIAREYRAIVGHWVTGC